MSPSKPKVVCISGASAGIGRAAAEVFAEHGYALALGARRVERLHELEFDLKKRGAPEVWSQALDVTVEASVRSFGEATHKKFGCVDVLVNNAGLAAGVDRLATIQEADWELMLNTNVVGVLRMTRQFLPPMLARNAGHIINMGSIAGHVVYEGGGVYCASKHAVRALTKTLRLEVHGTNVRISSIDPGMVETEFSVVRFKDQAKADAVYKGMTPLNGRDIAECVYFAASRPPHVNIEEIMVMPVDQAAIHKVNRSS